MFDKMIASDWHLGGPGCQARLIVSFLDRVAEQTTCLILNGDTFESLNLRKLKDPHWQVLKRLRRLQREIDVVWLAGNHDGSAEMLSLALGVDAIYEYEFTSHGRRIICMHGHQFKKQVVRLPVVTEYLNDRIQTIKHTRASKREKRGESRTLRNAEKIVAGAVAYAQSRRFHTICCGHTHYPACEQLGSVCYANSGCWIDQTATYLTVQDGEVQLHNYRRTS